MYRDEKSWRKHIFGSRDSPAEEESDGLPSNVTRVPGFTEEEIEEMRKDAEETEEEKPEVTVPPKEKSILEEIAEKAKNRVPLIKVVRVLRAQPRTYPEISCEGCGNIWTYTGKKFLDKKYKRKTIGIQCAKCNHWNYVRFPDEVYDYKEEEEDFSEYDEFLEENK